MILEADSGRTSQVVDLADSRRGRRVWGGPHCRRIGPAGGGSDPKKTATQPAAFTCEAYVKTSTSYIDISGAPIAVTSSAQLSDVATITHWTLPSNGRTMDELSPPAGFSPLTSANGWLTMFGFPERPASTGTSLTAFQSEFGNFKGFHPFTTPCSSNQYSAANTAGKSVPSSPATYQCPSSACTSIWAGEVVYGSSYRRAIANMRVPTFSGGCVANTSFTLWVGLGNSPLLQNGWSVQGDNTKLQGMVIWYEAVGNATGRGEPEQFPYGPNAVYATSGQLVSAETYYDSLVTPNEAYFSWYNYNTGWAQDNLGITAVKADNGVTYPVSDYYNGSQADFIDERPETSPQVDLRNFGTAGWENAQVATPGGSNTNIYGLNPQTITMTNESNTATIAQVAGNHMIAPDNWNTQWKSCH
jgi:hypothetical protein